jgi:hypothetical protein
MKPLFNNVSSLLHEQAKTIQMYHGHSPFPRFFSRRSQRRFRSLFPMSLMAGYLFHAQSGKTLFASLWETFIKLQHQEPNHSVVPSVFKHAHTYKHAYVLVFSYNRKTAIFPSKRGLLLPEATPWSHYPFHIHSLAD